MSRRDMAIKALPADFARDADRLAPFSEELAKPFGA
jgi:hypothetical protein